MNYTSSDVLEMVNNIEERRGDWLVDLDSLKFLALDAAAL